MLELQLVRNSQANSLHWKMMIWLTQNIAQKCNIFVAYSFLQKIVIITVTHLISNCIVFKRSKRERWHDTFSSCWNEILHTYMKALYLNPHIDKLLRQICILIGEGNKMRTILEFVMDWKSRLWRAPIPEFLFLYSMLFWEKRTWLQKFFLSISVHAHTADTLLNPNSADVLSSAKQSVGSFDFL